MTEFSASSGQAGIPIVRLRGRQVILGPDLAHLYAVQVRVLNQAVKRNIERFPPDFMFQLTWTEVELLHQQGMKNTNTSTVRSQSVILEKESHLKFRPFAFTEEGIAMLSSVLTSRNAVRVNISIMRAFVQLRHALLANRDIARRVDKLEGQVRLHDTDICFLKTDFRKIQSPPGQTGPRVKGFWKES